MGKAFEESCPKKLYKLAQGKKSTWKYARYNWSLGNVKPLQTHQDGENPKTVKNKC